jgi:hypothetical protein
MHQAHFKEALAALKKGGALLPAADPRRVEVQQLAKRCQRLLALNTQLPAILGGSKHPASAAERIEFGRLCALKELYAAAARLHRDAFAAERGSAGPVPAGVRYDAACDAALAGCGQGKDGSKLDDKERGRLRQQALDWLRADLAWWGRALAGGWQTAATVRQQLRHWQGDPDLAGVRDKAALAKLPEAERAGWRKLWAGVDYLRRRSAGKK